jgi:hypothetical protein
MAIILTKLRTYDQRATPMFCKRCGHPGHMQDNQKCPKISESKDQSWPCLIYAEHHRFQGDTRVCPHISEKQYYKCLNCIAEGRADTNHRTDFHKCPAKEAVVWREKYVVAFKTLPSWAVSIEFPSTDQLREAVQQGHLDKSNSKEKNDGNVKDTVRKDGPSAIPGTYVLNRKGLMAPKGAQQTPPEPEVVEIEMGDLEVVEPEVVEPSDDEPKDGATEETAVVVSSQASSNSHSASTPSRKVGHSQTQTGILAWAKPIGPATNCPVTPTPNADDKPDACPSAHDEQTGKNTPKRKRRSTTPTGGKKKTRTVTVRIPRRIPPKRAADSNKTDTAEPPVEPTAASEEATDVLETIEGQVESNDIESLEQYFEDLESSLEKDGPEGEVVSGHP